MRTLAEEWNSYVVDVTPNDVPEIQLIAMRRAFHAGASVVLDTNLMIRSQAIDEETGWIEINGMDDECQVFADDVAAGEA